MVFYNSKIRIYLKGIIMTKFQKRDIATSLTSLIFVIIAITGVLMFFHLFDNYTKQLHEIIGLFFVAAVFLHVIFNWKSMKTYFSKKIFIFSLVLVSVFSLSFILNTSDEGVNPKKVIITSVLNSPIEKTFDILGSDMSKASSKLKNVGIEINKSKTIAQIAKKNNKTPFEIVSIILE
jgi:CDP-diglyceride synthetase